ncbi:hypothetical protein OG474_25025 [Kribbella sp. NBC_01505]|uniref:hypothetical protein n=1 Tax=Kribbella sp. NBC_01505 TaxID=2903580 RepID=UPI003865D985
MQKTGKRLAILAAAAIAVTGSLIAATDTPATAATRTKAAAQPAVSVRGGPPALSNTAQLA